MKGPIGVFDSGFGGLTILREFLETMPEYDFVYIGDNARAPYGNRSFEMIYSYTRESVMRLFEMDSPLVILACNTASARALRNIQQIDLPKMSGTKRVLGVIRPTAEMIGTVTKTRHVGILATAGTVMSNSYPVEINKIFPDITVTQQACPILVPLAENDEIDNPGCDYFVKKYIDELISKDTSIDTVLLGCTHYPVMIESFRRFIPEHINIVQQDSIVAASLKDYLSRHKEIDEQCSKNSSVRYFTTDSIDNFSSRGRIFLGKEFSAEKIIIG